MLDASEMPPTFNVSNDLIIGIIAGGDHALRNPIEGAEDSLTESVEDLKKHNLTSKDVVIGIAASGRTPYVISGLEYSNSIGAKTIALSTSVNTEIGKIANLSIEVAVGSEAITGSTRMKSGTAQKLVLNTISTSVMVKLGKVYENWMIDVKPSNKKLRERAINMVMDITKQEREVVTPILEETSYSPKLAVLMIMKEVSLEEAKKLLEEHNGVLREVLYE